MMCTWWFGTMRSRCVIYGMMKKDQSLSFLCVHDFNGTTSAKWIQKTVSTCRWFSSDARLSHLARDFVVIFLFLFSLSLLPSVFVGTIFLGTKNGSRSLATQKNKPLCVKIIFLATEIVAYLFLCSQLSVELDRRWKQLPSVERYSKKAE